MKSKATVITTGLGFIASHLARKLLSKGNQAKVIDNLFNHLEDSLTEFSAHENFHLVKHDVSDPFTAIDEEIERVFYLAAFVSVPDSFTKPLHTHRVNETSFINALECRRKHKVKKLVYASSRAVCGSSENVPLKESECLITQSPYGLAKFNNERYANYFNQAFGLSSIGLRFFNVYGLGQKPDSVDAGVIYIFMEMFNIGRGVQNSVNELFNTIKNITGYNQSDNYSPPRIGDVQISCSDPSKINKRIGFSAKWPLKKRIVRIKEVYNARLNLCQVLPLNQ